MNTEEKKNTEIMVIDLDIRNLPAYQGMKEKLVKIGVDNPFIEVIDNKTLTKAKEHRKNVRQGRYDLQNGKKSILENIKDRITTFTKDVGSKTTELIDINLSLEEKQDKSIKDFETIKEAEKVEQKRLDNLRIEAHKKTIDDFKNEITISIESANTFTICDVTDVINDFNPDVEEFDELLETTKDDLLVLVSKREFRIEELRLAQVEKDRIKKEGEKLQLEKDRMKELRSYGYFYEKDDLAELPEEDYSNIMNAKKILFNEKQKKDDLKENAGIARSKILSEIGVPLDASTCADMPEEVWKSFHESKNNEYQSEQNRIVTESLTRKKNKDSVLKFATSLGYTIDEAEEVVSFAKHSLTVKEMNVDVKSSLDMMKHIYETETKRVNDLKPDREKALEVVKSLQIAYDPHETVIKDEGLCKIIGDLIGEADGLINKYIEIINNY